MRYDTTTGDVHATHGQRVLTSGDRMPNFSAKQVQNNSDPIALERFKTKAPSLLATKNNP
jgi:hypothetical protein